MAASHGKSSTISFSPALTMPGEVTTWSVDCIADMADVTSSISPSDWRERLAGHNSWTATVTAFWNTDDVKLVLQVGVAAAELKLYMTSVKHLIGDVIITGSNVNAEITDGISVTFTCQGSGSLAYASD